MGKSLIASSRAMVVGVALLPAIVFACVVLVQDGTLSSPNTNAIVATPAPVGVASAVWRGALVRATHPLANVASGQSDAITDGWVGVILVIALGGGIAVMRLRGPASSTDQRLDPSDAHDRSVLIETCIDVSDTVPTASHRDELLEALAKVGVRPVEVAAGEPFDSKRHRAAGRVPTSDPGRRNLVAKTERTGFVDRGKRLRYPSVLVYDADVGRRS